MGTVINALKTISAYPIPEAVFIDAASENGIGINDEATTAVRESSGFKRAKARIYTYLAEAPNLSQGGISFSFTSTEKSEFRKKALELINDADGNIDGSGCYGWMGENF